MLMETGSIEDFEDYREFFQVLLDTLDMKTPEGQMLKADFESVFNLMERALGMVMTHPEEIDDEEYEQMNDELLELFELFEQHSEAFTDAAKKAGLTDSEIQQLNELLHD